MATQNEKVVFKAFNIKTSKFETFSCVFRPGIHARFEDAAQSHLLNVEKWTRRQVHNSRPFAV